MAPAFDQALPLDLQCLCLTYLPAAELASNTHVASKDMHALVMALLGAVDAKAAVVRPDAALTARFQHLAWLRSNYDEMRLAQRVPTDPDALNLFAVLENFCVTVGRQSRFEEKLVALDDSQLRDFLGVPVVDFKSKRVTFGLFVTIFDLIKTTSNERERYLLRHYCFPGDTLCAEELEGALGEDEDEDEDEDEEGADFMEATGLQSPRKRARRFRQQGGEHRRRPSTGPSGSASASVSVSESSSGALTRFGRRSCDRIFNFFDADGDGRLGWEELSAINRAAGLPLSHRAYAWVQASYATDETGRLTREGYREMFLENFVRVPQLMFKDLERLHSFIDKTDKVALTRDTLQAIEDAEARVRNGEASDDAGHGDSDDDDSDDDDSDDDDSDDDDSDEDGDEESDDERAEQGVMEVEDEGEWAEQTRRVLEQTRRMLEHRDFMQALSQMSAAAPMGMGVPPSSGPPLHFQQQGGESDGARALEAHQLFVEGLSAHDASATRMSASAARAT